MNLIIFDIDGTLIDSAKLDDQCFIQAFRELFAIDLSLADWSDYEHVTNSGITYETFQKYKGRSPRTSEIEELRNHIFRIFKTKLNNHEIKEVKGAKNALHALVNIENIRLAIATGCWKHTSMLKLSSAGFELNDIPLFSSDDHFSRAEITQKAISYILEKWEISELDSITYVGDGLWDMLTSKSLNINFIGIDYRKNGKLLKAGADKLMTDLENVEKLISLATSHTSN